MKTLLFLFGLLAGLAAAEVESLDPCFLLGQGASVDDQGIVSQVPA